LPAGAAPHSQFTHVTFSLVKESPRNAFLRSRRGGWNAHTDDRNRFGACCEEADTLETTNACGNNENNNGGLHPDLNLPDYLIIGAGGSGIQTALLLDKYGYSYNVLEAKDSIGSFWARLSKRHGSSRSTRIAARMEAF
jgi:hypothetical protein